MVGSFKVAVKAQHHKTGEYSSSKPSQRQAGTLAPKKAAIASKHLLIQKRILNKTPASIPATIPTETRTIPHFQLQSPLRFTVTKPVTSQEMSIAVESRDVNPVFGKIS